MSYTAKMGSDQVLRRRAMESVMGVYHLACQGHSQNGIDRGRAKKIGANKCHHIYLLGNPIEDR